MRMEDHTTQGNTTKTYADESIKKTIAYSGKDDRSSIARLEKITGQKTSKIITADRQISIFSKDSVLETSTVKVSVDKNIKK